MGEWKKHRYFKSRRRRGAVTIIYDEKRIEARNERQKEKQARESLKERNRTGETLELDERWR